MFNLSVKVHAEKTRVKINQLETVHFIKVNELKVTQLEIKLLNCFVWFI